MMTKLLLPLASSLLLPLSGLHAAVIGVDWGSSGTVTSNQSLNLPGSTDYDTTRVWQQTGSTPITPSSGYTGQPFYGIIQYNNGTTAGNLNSAIVMNRPAGARDRFYLQSPAGGTGTKSLSGLVYVKKDDFMNGLNGAAPLRFDEESSMSITISNFTVGAGSATRVVRLAVLNDGQWYVSNSYRSSVTTFTVSDLLSQKWALYPGDTAPLAGTSYNEADYTVYGSELQNIEAVGVYFLNQNATPTDARDFSFDQFQVSFAAPIPEPSTVALLGVAALGAGLLRSRIAR